MNSLISNIIRFVIIIGIQLFILNDKYIQGSTVVGANSWLKPQFYILFLLMLPYRIHPLLSLVIGFVTGLVIDIYSNTYGLHCSAALLMILIRHYLLERLIQFNQRDALKYATPSLSVLGARNFLIYTLFCTIVYNTYYHMIRVWSFQPNKILYTILNIVLGIIVSEILFFISQAFFVQSRNRRKKVRRI
jgi:rod shape-determining protein MreD